MGKTEQALPQTRRRLSDVRVSELLDVATTVFLEKGFDAASTAVIAERANASKATFYKRFPNKKSLFLAVMERHTEKVFHQLGEFPVGGALETSLLGFGKRFLSIVLSKEHVALVRLMSAEVGRQQDLAEHFYQNGAKRAEILLEHYLVEQIRAGRLQGAEPGTMARHFTSLITGSPIRWVVLGFDPNPLSAGGVETHLKDCLQLFLRGYAV